MFWLKACKRCRGDLREAHGETGKYVMCLQCGRELSDVEERALRGAGESSVVGTRAA
ncbi:MAG: hypothetical protein HW397_414 [Dehalococcoidia bacterium]|nr:hypothetical protein [Dehalococcoidia bacterium]